MAKRVEVPENDVMVCVYAEVETYPEQEAFASRFARPDCVGVQFDPDGIQMIFPLGTVLLGTLPPIDHTTIDRLVQEMADYCGCPVSYSYFDSTSWADVREERGVFSEIPEEELEQMWVSEAQCREEIEYGETYSQLYEEYRKSF